MAVDIAKADFAQPRQLCLDIEELIRWILVDDPKPLEECRVQCGRRGRHVLKIAEHTVRCKTIENLRVEGALPCIREVVDREAGNHRIERGIENRKPRIEIVAHHLDRRIVGESPLEPFDHRVREVECDAMEVRLDQPYEGEEAAVTAPDIEDPVDARRQEFEQRGLAFCAVRNGVRLLQVSKGVLR